MAQTKAASPRQAAHSHEQRNGTHRDSGETSLRQSPTMTRLLEALEGGTDIGHYGQFTFATVARHFLPEERIVALFATQPEMDEERARAILSHINERDYNPPRRERIIEQQARQDFQIIPDPDDPDSGQLYRELTFPETVYEGINDYYEQSAPEHYGSSHPRSDSKASETSGRQER